MNDNNATVSPTVKSLLDTEHSTVGTDVYHGKPMFVFNPGGPYPFSIGLAKAKLVMKHIDAIRKFVETNGASIT